MSLPWVYSYTELAFGKIIRARETESKLSFRSFALSFAAMIARLRRSRNPLIISNKIKGRLLTSKRRPFIVPFAAFRRMKDRLLGSSANPLDDVVMQCEQTKLEIFVLISSSVG